MTLRRALLALSLVAVAAPGAARTSQSAPSPPTQAPAPGTAAPVEPAPASPQPPPTAPATRSARPDETPIDPLSIAFDVSVDHDAEDAAGPKLLKYVIDFVPVAGEAGKAHTVDLGKPKPVDGSISVALSKVLVPGTYTAHVRAIGRGLRTSTVTVGPFVITEKTGKTKSEIDKELRAPDKPEDKRIKKPKEPPRTEAEPTAAPPPAPTEASKDDSKPARKGGFWKKFYEKVVGDPQI